MPAPSGLKLGIALPQVFTHGRVDVDAITRFAQRAEDLGLDDVWAIEQIVGRHAVLEPIALLTYVAALTQRVRLGTAVLVTPLRNPVQLAKEIASVDQLSGGRMIVGVGLGTSTSSYAAFGIDPEHRAGRYAEGIRVLKALWTQDSAQLDGRFWKLGGTLMQPKPLQKPHPPLWFGARVEPAMRRAARMADGWMGAGSTPIDEFYPQLAQMRAILKEEGRDESTFTLSKRFYMAVDSEPERGRKRLGEWIGAYYGDNYGTSTDTADRWGIIGTPDQCVEELTRARDAGLDHILLHPISEDTSELELIAKEIAPNL